MFLYVKNFDMFINLNFWLRFVRYLICDMWYRDGSKKGLGVDLFEVEFVVYCYYLLKYDGWVKGGEDVLLWLFG